MSFIFFLTCGTATAKIACYEKEMFSQRKEVRAATIFIPFLMYYPAALGIKGKTT